MSSTLNLVPAAALIAKSMSSYERANGPSRTLGQRSQMASPPMSRAESPSVTAASASRFASSRMSETVGNGLKRNLRQLSNLGQMLKLTLHDLSATDQPMKRRLVHNGPQPQRRITSKHRLTTHTSVDQPLNLIL